MQAYYFAYLPHLGKKLRNPYNKYSVEYPFLRTQKTSRKFFKIYSSYNLLSNSYLRQSLMSS